MKKGFLAAIGCMMIWGLQAKEITYNVYFNEITEVRGELYQYSERYLGTTDVIMNDSHYFELDKIKIVVEDPKTGVNTTTSQVKTQASESVKTQLPLSEETLLATNLAKKAESVAKQIYRIRETRMNILAGDVEHMPADGKAMQLVLDELNKQEKALTSMFVGRTIVASHRESVSTNVSDTEKAIQQPLLKFSAQDGPLSANSEKGNPVMLTVIRTTQSVLAPVQPKKGEPVYEDQIVSSKTTITYMNKTLYAQVYNH